MNASTPPSAHVAAPGTEKPRRFRPKLRYELIGCGLHGHEILGTDAAALRPEDELFARESGGLRWYRCLRCDSWLALTPPEHPTRKYPPARDEIMLPLRGKPLRDRYVLRLIAVDRMLHFLVLSALAAAVFLFAGDRAALNAEFTRILNDLQGGVGGPLANSKHGIVHDLQYLFAVSIKNLYLVGAAIAAYALLEGIEAIGLWFAKRWAEYLTFVATIVFIPYEIDELIKGVTALKLVAFIINVAVAVYLLYAKRLFGLRGGGRAERAEREADTGWTAIERATPKSTPRAPVTGRRYRAPAWSHSRRVAGPGSTQRDVVAGGGLPAAVRVAAHELQAGPPGEIGRGERDPEQAEAEALRVPFGDRGRVPVVEPVMQGERAQVRDHQGPPRGQRQHRAGVPPEPGPRGGYDRAVPVADQGEELDRLARRGRHRELDQLAVRPGQRHRAAGGLTRPQVLPGERVRVPDLLGQQAAPAAHGQHRPQLGGRVPAGQDVQVPSLAGQQRPRPADAELANRPAAAVQPFPVTVDVIAMVGTPVRGVGAEHRLDDGQRVGDPLVGRVAQAEPRQVAELQAHQGRGVDGLGTLRLIAQRRRVRRRAARS